MPSVLTNTTSLDMQCAHQYLFIPNIFGCEEVQMPTAICKYSLLKHIKDQVHQLLAYKNPWKLYTRLGWEPYNQAPKATWGGVEFWKTIWGISSTKVINQKSKNTLI